ncbi:hypothetical protein ACNKHX_02160 [Shigella flexneri]
MLYTGYHYNDGPSAVRYPRGNAVGVELTPLEKLPIGKGIVKRRGKNWPSLTLYADARRGESRRIAERHAGRYSVL